MDRYNNHFSNQQRYNNANYPLNNNINQDSDSFGVQANIYQGINNSRIEEGFSFSTGIYGYSQDSEKRNNSIVSENNIYGYNNNNQTNFNNPNNFILRSKNQNNNSQGNTYNNQANNNLNNQINNGNAYIQNNFNNFENIKKEFNNQQEAIQINDNGIKSQAINIGDIEQPNPIFFALMSQKNKQINQNNQIKLDNNNQFINQQPNNNSNKQPNNTNEIKRDIKKENINVNEFNDKFPLLDNNEEFNTIFIEKKKPNNNDFDTNGHKKNVDNMNNELNENINDNQIKEKSIIIAPSLTNIVKNDLNLDKNNENQQNKKKDNNILQKTNNIAQNDENEKPLINKVSFSIIEETTTVVNVNNKNIIPEPNSNGSLRNNKEKSVYNLDDLADSKVYESQYKVNENTDIINKNDNLNNEMQIDNINNNNSINKEKSNIEVPGLTQIVMKDLNINKDNSNKKEEPIIVESIIFASKIQSQEKEENTNINKINSVSNENNNNENNSKINEGEKEINNSENKNFIQFPGLSQIVIKDLNLENNNSINQQNNSKCLQPAIISMKDMAFSNNDECNEAKLKNNKRPEDKKIIFNLSNSKDSYNPNINNDQNKGISKPNIQNSFCLLKYDSNDFGSNNLLNNNSDNLGLMNNSLPINVHNHPLKLKPLSRELCSLCLNQKSSQNGNKCENCPLIVCDECCGLINSIRNNSYYKHEHPLTLFHKQSSKCNLCGELGMNQQCNFSFSCDTCNFEICPKCYFAK